MHKLVVPDNLESLYKEMSQDKIARLFGVSQVTVSNWLRAEPKDPKQVSRRNRRRRHGPNSVGHYEEELIRQKNLCALCFLPMIIPHQDHDHICCARVPDKRGKNTLSTCGKCLRGLLCSGCNRRLSAVEELLLSGIIIPKKFKWFCIAQDYLLKWKEIHGNRP